MKLNEDTLQLFPRRLAWPNVTERDRFDERLGTLNAEEGAIVDVTEDYVELTTDGPPTRGQLAAWVWFVTPERAAEIREFLSPAMRDAIDFYNDGS